MEQHGALRVHPVLGLLEDHRPRALDDGVGRLDAPLGGKAVLEERLRARLLHHLLVDLEALEPLPARRGLVLLAHRRPDVRVHDVGALDGLHGLVGDRDSLAARGGVGGGDGQRVGLEAARARADEVEVVPEGFFFGVFLCF